MNNKQIFGIITATMLMLSPILIGLVEDAEAKNYKKDAKKQLREAEDWADCVNQNVEKSNFYMAQGKFYHDNIFCDPDEQYKYDKLNLQEGINEYEDAANFILGEDFDEDDDDDNDE